MSSFRGGMRKWRAMLIAAARGLTAHALPILIAQLSSIGMMVVDTAVLGHVGATDLAAVAIGGGMHISVVFALVGVLQAVAPVVANLHGAGRDSLRLPCFVQQPGRLVLPAFGAFTGGHTVSARADVRCYAVGAGRVWALPGPAAQRITAARRSGSVR